MLLPDSSGPTAVGSEKETYEPTGNPVEPVVVQDPPICSHAGREVEVPEVLYASTHAQLPRNCLRTASATASLPVVKIAMFDPLNTLAVPVAAVSVICLDSTVDCLNVATVTRAGMPAVIGVVAEATGTTITPQQTPLSVTSVVVPLTPSRTSTLVNEIVG